MGSNKYGQLCVDTGGEDISTPTMLDINDQVAASVMAIKESSFILYEDGTVSGCGRNNVGQLGDGTFADSAISSVKLDDPAVRLFGGPRAQSVFFVMDDKSIWGTGLNDRGQLGVGNTQNRNLPTRVEFDDQLQIDLLSVSAGHAVAVGTTATADEGADSTLSGLGEQ